MKNALENKIQIQEMVDTFRTFFDQSDDGMVLVDHTGIVKEWSRGFEKITGLSKESVIGKMHIWDAAEALYPFQSRTVEECEKIKADLMELVETKQHQTFIRHIKHAKTGAYRLFNIQYFPVAMPDKTMLGGISRDVTEDIENDVWQALKDMPDGTMYHSVRDMKTKHLKIDYVTGSWEKIMGLTADETIADVRNIFKNIQPDDLKILLRKIEESLDPLSNFTAEVRYLHPVTGKERWIQISSYPHYEGESVCAYGFIFDITDRKEAELDLLAEKERLERLSNNLPEGTLYRLVFNRDTKERYLEYVSSSWERVIGITPESVSQSIEPFHDILHPEDRKRLIKVDDLANRNLANFIEEVRFTKKGKVHWLRISSHPYIQDNKIIRDGLMIDITASKENERQLTQYQEKLELMVKERTDELHATNEELYSSNEELYASNEELYATNHELEKYRTKLEDMVKERNSEIFAKTKDLEVLNRRQNILIKMLQILQTSENIPQAINESLARIGEYVKAHRVHVFEKNADGTAIRCAYEWCDASATRSFIGQLQNVPFKIVEPMFEVFDSGGIVRTSDVSIFNPKLVRILEAYGVKSTLCLPLMSGGVNYGFVGFDDCIDNREWEHNELELLKSLSQIISSATRRHRAETALRLSQQTMRTVLDNINALVFAIDYDNMKILFANKSLKNYAGNDIEGKECWKVLQKDKTDVCEFCPRHRLFDDDNQSTGVYHWERYNELFGRCFAYDVAAIEWIDGRIVKLNVAYDIQELVLAKEKAEEADRLKSAFLANMSHEIRTPLNGITGFLRFLVSDNLTQKRKLDYINVINNCSMQLVKLIDDIIDVAKIEAKQMNIAPIPLDLNHLMRELHMFFEAYLHSNDKGNVMLVLDEGEFMDNSVIMVDPMRLRQVISNLIGNATKFTEKGYIRFGYRKSAPDQLEFVVEDTGIGLLPEQHDVIFKRFQQAELSTSRLYGGTGLGLNIASNLVQLMGGEMWVKSTRGVGSSFYFTISYVPVAN